MLSSSCKKEKLPQESEYTVTIKVTATYDDGKTVEVEYKGKMVWKSDHPLKSARYNSDDKKLVLSYQDFSGQNYQRIFKDGQVQ